MRREEEGRVSEPERGECVREGGRRREGGGGKSEWAREGGVCERGREGEGVRRREE